jgi:hypothetical protein
MSTPAIEDQGERARRDAGAVFAPTRVRGARGPRILASVVVVALAGLIAVGAFDRLLEPTPADQQVALAAPTNAGVAAVPSPSHRDSRPPPHGSRPSPIAIGGGLGPLIALDVRPAGSHLFVHGDVFALDIVRVRVKLTDAAGHVAARQAIDIPGGSRAFLLGAVPRFDAHFFLPDEVQADGYVVSATAIDAGGRALFTVSRSIARSEAM